MIDQMLLGEFSTYADWREALEEYDTDWYIGLERESDWTTAILNQTPNMFSMGHNTQQVNLKTSTCNGVVCFKTKSIKNYQGFQ